VTPSPAVGVQFKRLCPKSQKHRETYPQITPITQIFCSKAVMRGYILTKLLLQNLGNLRNLRMNSEPGAQAPPIAAFNYGHDYYSYFQAKGSSFCRSAQLTLASSG
jgi:hypothetical protein